MYTMEFTRRNVCIFPNQFEELQKKLLRCVFCLIGNNAWTSFAGSPSLCVVKRFQLQCCYVFLIYKTQMYGVNLLHMQ